MTIGVMKQSGDAWEYVDTSNVHEFVQAELYCVQVAVDLVKDKEHFTLSYIFGNVQLIRKLLIYGSVATNAAKYQNVISLWTGRARRAQCVVHELVLEKHCNSRFPFHSYTHGEKVILSNLASISTPLKTLRLNGGIIDLAVIDTSQLEVLEMQLFSPENATNLVEALESKALINLKYLKLKEPSQLELSEEAFATFCHTMKHGLPHLKGLNVAVTTIFPQSLEQFASSVPATVESLTIDWKREGSLHSLSELVPAVPQLVSLLIDLKERRLDPFQLYEGLLPVFGALPKHQLKHLSIGPSKKPFKCKLLHHFLTILSSMTSLETLNLLVPMRLDTKCCDTIIDILVRNPQLRTFSYHALMGPQHFQRKIHQYLKLNRVRYHDVLAKGKLPLPLWPRVLAIFPQEEYDLVFYLLQQKNDELITVRN